MSRRRGDSLRACSWRSRAPSGAGSTLSGRWGVEAALSTGIKKPPAAEPGRLFKIDHEEVSVLGRPGSDLLFQVLRLSTIGAGEFYGRVRDGIGYRLPASTTRPAKDRYQRSVVSNQNL